MSATVSILFAATITGKLTPAQQLRHVVVPGPQARPSVDDEYGQIGVTQRRPRLGLDRARKVVALFEVDAAGVDQRQLAPIPVGVQLLAVSGDTGALVHDRLTGFRQAVDERGFPDVRVADDSDLHRGRG